MWQQCGLACSSRLGLLGLQLLRSALNSTSRQATAARSLVCRCPPSLSSRRHKFYRSLLQCAEALCCDATAPLLSWHSTDSSRTIASSLAGLEAQVGGGARAFSSWRWAGALQPTWDALSLMQVRRPDLQPAL